MKVLVTGASGQLGTDLCEAFRGFDIVPLTHRDIEISDMASTREVLGRHRPDVIINTAADTRVDDCEAERDQAFLVNALGPKNLAIVAGELGARLFHISTDYVFGGGAGAAAAPFTEFDRPAPVNVYGRSKLAGEDFVRHFCFRHFIIRTSGLFGRGGDNFVERVLRLAERPGPIKIINDQIFSPTFSHDLAVKIVQLVATAYYGVFHITNRGACSWYEFAGEIFRLAGLETEIVPVTSAGYPTPAERPRFSQLDNYHLRLLGLDDMRTWQQALAEYMNQRPDSKGNGK